MNIGGEDIRIPVPSGPTALDFGVRVAHLRWPRAVFMADDNANPLRYDELEFHNRSEIVIYKDIAASEAWGKLGYHESLRGTMIYLICDPEDLTLVLEDDACSEIRALADAIIRRVRTAFPLALDRQKAA